MHSTPGNAMQPLFISLLIANSFAFSTPTKRTPRLPSVTPARKSSRTCSCSENLGPAPAQLVNTAASQPDDDVVPDVRHLWWFTNIIFDAPLFYSYALTFTWAGALAATWNIMPWARIGFLRALAAVYIYAVSWLAVNAALWRQKWRPDSLLTVSHREERITLARTLPLFLLASCKFVGIAAGSVLVHLRLYLIAAASRLSL